MIPIKMSVNEQGSERYESLEKVVRRHQEAYSEIKFMNLGDLKIDLLIGNAGFELKEKEDYISSMFNGHLAEQRRAATKMGIPCCVPVFGSIEDVVNAIPTQGPNGRKSQQEMFRDTHRIIKGDAALTASNFPPMYLSTIHDLSMEFIVARANAINSGAIALPGAKAETVQEAMMRCLPRVGPTLSTAMYRSGIRVALVANVVRGGSKKERVVIKDTGILKMVPGMGQKTAEGILQDLK